MSDVTSGRRPSRSGRPGLARPDPAGPRRLVSSRWASRPGVRWASWAARWVDRASSQSAHSLYKLYLFKNFPRCTAVLRDTHPGFEFFPFRIRIKELKYFNRIKWFRSSWKYAPGCSSRIRILFFTHHESRIQGSKRHGIPDLVPYLECG
jgi:hypothetical protein